MFEILTAAERDQLAARLGHAAQEFRDEYAALCATPPATLASLAPGYGLPASGPSAWLGACTDAVFAAAEVQGATASSAYWARPR